MKEINKDIKWAVLGTGAIANEMAQTLQKSGKRLYAVGNRTHSKAVAFAEKYGVEKVYSDFNEMFTDPEADAIYITTPHNTHIGFIRKAIEGGKHVLVEKSITLNSEELEEAVYLAEKNGVMIAEAMTIYHMPLYRQLKELTDSGELGRVNMITMNFGSFKEYDMSNRFFNRDLAGGAMLDIGVYALSLIRWFMKTDPDRLLTEMRPAPTGVDEQATMLLSNEEGQMATVALSLRSKQPKRAMISCEKGYIEIMEYPRACKAVITDAVSGEVRTLNCGESADALKYEIDDFEAAIRSGENLLYLQNSIDVMELMTKARREWGLTYPEEEANDSQIRRISGYENMMREAEELIAGGQKCERLSGLIEALDAYYQSPQWKRDYADEEAGLLPADLKRGVLSEDGIYDLIYRYKDLVNYTEK